MQHEIFETFIELKQKRSLHFPFPLSQTGKVRTYGEVIHDFPSHLNLEFCLRLSSDEEYAVDVLDGVTIRTPFPHLFIKRPGIHHQYRINGKRHAIFLIYSTAMIPLFDTAGIRTDQPVIPFELTAELQSLIDQFRELFAVSQQYGSAEKFDTTAYRILQEIYLQQYQKQPGEQRMEHKLREIASDMQLNFHRNDVVDAAVNKFGYSKRTFLRYWSEYYHISPSKYVENLRMQEAQRLLKVQSLSIREIAERTGYSTASYFIQSYKRHFGTTPATDRRSSIKRSL